MTRQESSGQASVEVATVIVAGLRLA